MGGRVREICRDWQLQGFTTPIRLMLAALDWDLDRVDQFATAAPAAAHPRIELGGAEVSITWSGDTGIASKGRVYGSGFLGFAPMFWASNNGARGERIKFFGINPDVCFPFGP